MALKKLKTPYVSKQEPVREESDEGTSQIKNAARKTQKIGDDCFNQWEKSQNLNMARTGISAFKTSLYANSLLIRIKEKLGGNL